MEHPLQGFSAFLTLPAGEELEIQRTAAVGQGALCCALAGTTVTPTKTEEASYSVGLTQP